MAAICYLLEHGDIGASVGGWSDWGCAYIEGMCSYRGNASSSCHNFTDFCRPLFCFFQTGLSIELLIEWSVHHFIYHSENSFERRKYTDDGTEGLQKKKVSCRCEVKITFYTDTWFFRWSGCGGGEGTFLGASTTRRNLGTWRWIGNCIGLKSTTRRNENRGKLSARACACACTLLVSVPSLLHAKPRFSTNSVPFSYDFYRYLHVLVISR